MTFPTTPVTSAVISSFLRFRVSEVELAMGPVHGNYAELQRGVSARLSADPHQPVASEPGFLDALEGRLCIAETSDLDAQWSGAICRNGPFTDPETGFRQADYQVNLDVSPKGFDALVALFGTGQELFGLSLDFQNIDCPADAAAMVGPGLWDDLAYPHVALTSFLLRWKPTGGCATPGYSWPIKRD